MALAWGLTVGPLGCGARSGLEAPFGDQPEVTEESLPEPMDPPTEPPPKELVQPAGCDDPDAAYVYAITSGGDMLRYDPANRDYLLMGPIDCPSSGGGPFSMAVSREAIAYIIYTSGHLMELDLKDLSCRPTAFEPRFEGEPFHVFGMGYAADPDAPTGETMYVSDIDFTFEGVSAGLASIDDETFELSPVGPFSENPSGVIELTGAGIDGPPHGYFLNGELPGGTLVTLDRDTAAVIESVPLDPGGYGSLAIAWWGGDFYVFKGSGQSTEVTRYDPDTGEATFDAILPGLVVGASSSTCAAVEAVDP